jgi:hypothetical protein
MQESKKEIAVLAGIKQVMSAFADNGIGKNQKNEQQGFAYRGIDDVLNRMSQHLVDADLIIIPKVINRDVQERINSRGNPLFYVTLTVEYLIASTIDGSTVNVVTVGEAMDSGDKATNKALSAAYKYMAFQTFAIPIADDADRTTHTLAPKPQGKTLSETDLESIRALCKQAEFDEAKICAIYDVPSLNAVPLSATAEITANLQKKIKAKTKEKVAA